MATALRPWGLRYHGRIAGAPMTTGFKKYPIYNNYSVAIMNGDPVVILNTGTGRGRINRINATATATTVTSSTGTTGTAGVLIGCEYTDPTTAQFLQRHYYPGSIAKDDIKGFVIDDPFALFTVQADETLNYNHIGCNASLIQHVVGNTATGNSGLALDGSSVANTTTLPLKIVGFLEDARNAVGDTYPTMIVRFNQPHHLHLTGTSAS